jgi:hypothetical protein
VIGRRHVHRVDVRRLLLEELPPIAVEARAAHLGRRLLQLVLVDVAQRHDVDRGMSTDAIEIRDPHAAHPDRRVATSSRVLGLSPKIPATRSPDPR